jgi:hypothetical protein
MAEAARSAQLIAASQQFANHPPLSAMLANDFENRAVHNPPDQKEMEAHYEWEGYFGKRAPVPHHRFVVSADCSFPS